MAVRSGWFSRNLERSSAWWMRRDHQLGFAMARAQRAHLRAKPPKSRILVILGPPLQFRALTYSSHYGWHKILYKWWNFHADWTIWSRTIVQEVPKMMVSLKQAKWYSTLFQRWLCPWNKRSGTRRFFKDDGVLETSVAALVAFSERTVSLEQAQRYSSLFQRWRCP